MENRHNRKGSQCQEKKLSEAESERRGLLKNEVVMLQITLALHNKPLKHHSEAPEAVSDPQNKSTQTFLLIRI